MRGLAVRNFICRDVLEVHGQSLRRILLYSGFRASGEPNASAHMDFVRPPSRLPASLFSAIELGARPLASLSDSYFFDKIRSRGYRGTIAD